MAKFARLENHDGLQVLCRVEAKEHIDRYGPCVVTRCDPSIVVEITQGPWPDDESGWDAAEAAMEAADLGAFAAKAKKMAANFAGPST